MIETNKWPILFVGLLSTWGDAATSWVASQHPNLSERNPIANPFLETLGILSGQVLILEVGEKLKVNPIATAAIALAPTLLPFYATTNNLALIAIEEAKTYPWKQCPLLYNERKA